MQPGICQMGYSVASAGDVNGDGYSDVVVVDVYSSIMAKPMKALPLYTMAVQAVLVPPQRQWWKAIRQVAHMGIP
jgi:hypothetical protein